MEDKAILVVEATPNPENMEDLQKYGSKSYSILAKHGGVPVANYKVESTMGSGDSPAMVGVFSFPNKQAIEDLLINDPDYQQIVPFRDKGFKSIQFMICSEQTQ